VKPYDDGANLILSSEAQIEQGVNEQPRQYFHESFDEKNLETRLPLDVSAQCDQSFEEVSEGD